MDTVVQLHSLCSCQPVVKLLLMLMHRLGQHLALCSSLFIHLLHILQILHWKFSRAGSVLCFLVSTMTDTRGPCSLFASLRGYHDTDNCHFKKASFTFNTLNIKVSLPFCSANSQRSRAALADSAMGYSTRTCFPASRNILKQDR